MTSVRPEKFFAPFSTTLNRVFDTPTEQSKNRYTHTHIYFWIYFKHTFPIKTFKKAATHVHIHRHALRNFYRRSFGGRQRVSFPVLRVSLFPNRIDMSRSVERRGIQYLTCGPPTWAHIRERTLSPLYRRRPEADFLLFRWINNNLRSQMAQYISRFFRYL